MDEQNNEKPLSLSLSEFKTNIVKTINNSGLPIYVTELILKDIYNDVVQISNRIKDEESQQYNESLNNTQK